VVELLGVKISGKIVHNLFTCNTGSFLDICAFVLQFLSATNVHESKVILQNKTVKSNHGFHEGI
jgi:hypothetical protein